MAEERYDQPTIATRVKNIDLQALEEQLAGVYVLVFAQVELGQYLYRLGVIFVQLQALDEAGRGMLLVGSEGTEYDVEGGTVREQPHHLQQLLFILKVNRSVFLA